MIEKQVDSTKHLEWNALKIAPYVLGLHTFPKSDSAAVRQEHFRQWWRSFMEQKRGIAALKSFEAARTRVRNRTQTSFEHDLTTLWRLARACHGAITWDKSLDPGRRYRARVSKARRLRENLAYHARQLANGFKDRPPGLHWALWAAEQQAGVGDIRDKLRKQLENLPANVSEAERVAATKRLHLDEKRNFDNMWPEFFAALANELKERLPEIDGGPWLHLYTIGNLHYNKRLGGHVPALDTMLAFELTFHLRKWSLRQADHVLSAGEQMPKGGRPHNEVAASFINAALLTKREVTGDQIGNRLKRLPQGVGLRNWPGSDG